MLFLTETLPKFPLIPGSLQEAFVKRKKSFIERSSQRQKEIKNKIHVSENSQSKTVKEKSTGMFLTFVFSQRESGIMYLIKSLVLCSGSSVNCLKGVNKVRVSLPEDRKTAQALMHQRALRYTHICMYI